MHARELAELAAKLATHEEALIHAFGSFDQKGIERYWVASRCRLDRWSKAFARYASQREVSAGTWKTWELLRPILEEILISEILTRVWCAITSGHDRLHGTSELEPLTRSILVGHFEARHRALQLIAGGQGAAVEEAVALNRLRRRCERWTDLLLGELDQLNDVGELVFDNARPRSPAADLPEHSHNRISHPPGQVLIASLSDAFRRDLKGATANADLNEQIVSAIISSFPPEAFCSLSCFRSSWLVRMHNITAETQGILAGALAGDDSQLHPESALRRFENQLRTC